MSRQVDLKPSEYRVRGRKPFKRHLSDQFLKWLMTFAGVWAAIALYFYRSVFPIEPGWWAYAGAFIPGALLWLYIAFTFPADPSRVDAHDLRDVRSSRLKR